MAEDKEKEAADKFKNLINEVLDERETKAAADRAEAEKAEKEKAEKDRENRPKSLIATFLGLNN
jgi:hypothetical protein